MQKSRAALVAGSVVIAALAPGVAYAQMSLFVDFDGTGFGTMYSTSGLSSFTPSTTYTTPTLSTYSSPIGSYWLSKPSTSRRRPSTNNSYRREMQRRADERLEEQRREMQERKERERQERIDRIDRVQRVQSVLKTLDDLDEEYERTRREQSKLKRKIINDLLPEFTAAQEEYVRTRTTRLERLERSLDKINVPNPEKGQHYESVLLLGYLNTPEQAWEATQRGMANPFVRDGKQYSRVFAFGSESKLKDFGRVSLDHFLSEFGTLSDATMKEIGPLYHAEIDELVVHSNGLAVFEALIRSGYISKVGTLKVLGGDGVLMHLDQLEKLAEEKGFKLQVYVMKNDVVPLTPTGWQIIKTAEQLISPLASLQKAASLTLQMLGLQRKKADPKDRLYVQFLTDPDGGSWNVLEKHYYETYERAVVERVQAGAVGPDGTVSPSYRIIE